MMNPHKSLAEQLASAGIEMPAARVVGSLVKRSGELAGKLAAGVIDLQATYPNAPRALKELVSKSEADLPADLQASQELVSKSLKEFASKFASVGGQARAAKLSPERRREIAQLGVQARKKRTKNKHPIGF